MSSAASWISIQRHPEGKTSQETCRSRWWNRLLVSWARDFVSREPTHADVPKRSGVPPELTDAFPGSRFRPFSQVEVVSWIPLTSKKLCQVLNVLFNLCQNGRVAPAERLLPPANWNYNQDRFLSTFDAVISIRPNTNVLKRILHLKNSVRKAAELSTNAQHVQQIVRNQSNNFVDKRDLMEGEPLSCTILTASPSLADSDVLSPDNSQAMAHEQTSCLTYARIPILEFPIHTIPRFY